MLVHQRARYHSSSTRMFTSGARKVIKSERGIDRIRTARKTVVAPRNDQWSGKGRGATDPWCFLEILVARVKT